MSAALRTPQQQAQRNNRVAGMAVLFSVAMLGAAYAAVPLYKLFCQATGFGGTPARAAAGSSQVVNRIVTVRFDANTDAGLPWTFTPVMPQQSLKVGENKLAFFTAQNNSREIITGSATFNVSPDIVGQYFTKVQCFCFSEQKLQPGEKITMPVSYYIDPRIMQDATARDISEITLSYTFYRKTPDGESETASNGPARAAQLLPAPAAVR